jgi:hypothetical protein
MTERSERVKRLGHLLGRGGEKRAVSAPLGGPLKSGNELQAIFKGSLSITPEAREFVIDTLAEVLVLDYERNQAVREPTVKSPSGFNRRPDAGEPGSG